MLYINGIGNISPQQTTENESFLSELVTHEGEHFSCVEPNYKTLIPARRLRRMSRIIRMGIYAAKTCLAESQIDMPNAILVGTGLGCMQDTQRFLEEIYKNEEGLVAPTQFIQSTHNTISSAIALMLQCYNYNFTYVHRGFSFESALMDALMQASDYENANILVGGIDEIIEVYLDVTNRLKRWQPEYTADNNLLDLHQKGNQPGEGASFFMLGSQPTEKTYAKLKGIKMIYKPASEEINFHINAFLKEHNLDINSVDLVCLGLSGNPKRDAIYYNLENGVFQNSNISYFKHLCGEYKTASSFGMWLAAQILQKQVVPNFVKHNNFDLKNIRNVLIYNNYSNINHSLFLLEK